MASVLMKETGGTKKLSNSILSPISLPKIRSAAPSKDIPKWPIPTCWGSRGGPFALRRLTIGVGAEPAPKKTNVRVELPPMRPNKSKVHQSKVRRAAERRALIQAQRMEKMASRSRSNSPHTSSHASLPAAMLYNNAVAQVLHVELAWCATTKEVDKLMKIAERCIVEVFSENSNMTGRFAFRLREAIRAMRSSNFATPDCASLLALRKTLQKEERRRYNELIGHSNAKHDFSNEDSKAPLQNAASTSPASKQDQSSGAARQLPQVGESTTSPVAEQKLLIETQNKLATYIEEVEEDATEDDKNVDEKLMRQFSRISMKDPTVQKSKTRQSFGSRLHQQFMQKAIQPHQIGQDEKEQWCRVFQKLQEDDNLHKDDVEGALTLIGFVKPEPAWIKEAFHKQTNYNSLSRGQFIAFVQEYIAVRFRYITEAFQACDSDKSGYVDYTELSGLLVQFGVEPMRHVLVQVLSEVDLDGTGKVDLEGFQQVMDIVRCREGFSKEEYEEHMNLYQQFYKNKEPQLDLWALLNWMGFAIEEQQCRDMVKEVDVNDSGVLYPTEYLKCMRKVREHEILRIREIIRQIDISDGEDNGTISKDKLSILLDALGYAVDTSALEQTVRDVDIEDHHVDLDLSDVWKLLVLYRSREGLSSCEIDDINEAFRRYDKNADGEISTLEVGKVLRRLGYPTPFEVQQHLVHRVDLDESGELNNAELRKLLRMYREMELKMITDTFVARAGSKHGLITKDRAAGAFRTLGCCSADGDLPPVDPALLVLGEDGRPHFNLEGFTRTVIIHNRIARKAFQDNAGFSPIELVELTEKFKHYDKDSSGSIANSEIKHLIQETVPSIAYSVSARPRLEQLLKEVDADGNGTLEFGDFLRLMQQFREMEHQEKMLKQRECEIEAGFSHQEVKEFRELFLNDAGSCELSFQEVKNIMGMILPLGAKNEAELQAKFLEITGGKDRIDFPEFLLLMRRLLNENFAQIRERCSIDS